MKRETNFDHAFWDSVLEDDVTYCLSAEFGVSSVCDLGLTDALLEKVSSSLLIKTSGSTGEPKWVVHSKVGLLRHAALVNDHLEVTETDVFGLILPSYHVGGLGVIARAMVSGAKLVSFSSQWCARACVDFFAEKLVSVVSMVPTQLVDIVEESLTCPDCVRVVVIGGGRLTSEVRMNAIQLGWSVSESYGMTETGSQIATGELGTLGYLRLIGGWQVRLNEERRLEVKSDCLFKGYLVGSSGSLEFFDPKVDDWFATSDVVDLLEVDGEIGLKFLGRSDQQVKILGELVDVGALENSLRDILRDDVVIIALPDPRRGVKLFPVIEEPSVGAGIRDLGWGGLHRLEEVVVVPGYPRNAMGKLQRVKLAEVVESIVFSAD